jgi:tumor protein p53-inducible protein 3
MYPPPPGVTDVMGLEFVGEVVAYGSSVAAEASLPIGTRVMGLLSGGGNAGYAVVPATHMIPVPDALASRNAAGIPETWLTAFQLLRLVGNATSSDRILIHAAASGVGTAAVQIAKHVIGATVIGVASADEKLATVTSLGADHVVNYK